MREYYPPGCCNKCYGCQGCCCTHTQHLCPIHNDTLNNAIRNAGPPGSTFIIHRFPAEPNIPIQVHDDSTEPDDAWIKTHISTRFVSFTLGEDVNTGDRLTIGPDGLLYRAEREYVAVAYAPWRKGQSIEIALESKSNSSIYAPIRKRLSVAFAKCLEYCQSPDEDDAIECENWTRVVEGLIDEVRE